MSTGKPDCSQHRKDVFGETDMRKLAKEIGDLHYETLYEFLVALSWKIHYDGDRDFNSNKKMLGKKLLEAGEAIGLAALHIDHAYQLSKPFMSDQSIKENNQ